jgi:hypothetical protein
MRGLKENKTLQATLPAMKAPGNSIRNLLLVLFLGLVGGSADMIQVNQQAVSDD